MQKYDSTSNEWEALTRRIDGSEFTYFPRPWSCENRIWVTYRKVHWSIVGNYGAAKCHFENERGGGCQVACNCLSSHEMMNNSSICRFLWSIGSERWIRNRLSISLVLLRHGKSSLVFHSRLFLFLHERPPGKSSKRPIIYCAPSIISLKLKNFQFSVEKSLGVFVSTWELQRLVQTCSFFSFGHNQWGCHELDLLLPFLELVALIANLLTMEHPRWSESRWKNNNIFLVVPATKWQSEH